MEFRSGKFHGIDSERIPLFRGRKCSFRGYSEFLGRAHSEARNRTEWNYAEKLVFRNSQNSLTKWFVCTSKVIFSGPIFEICGCRVLLWGTLLLGGIFPARITQKNKNVYLPSPAIHIFLDNEDEHKLSTVSPQAGLTCNIETKGLEPHIKWQLT